MFQFLYSPMGNGHALLGPHPMYKVYWWSIGRRDLFRSGWCCEQFRFNNPIEQIDKTGLLVRPYCSTQTTRKPSWRKGKRATAVRVWRHLAKKSTANQRYAISYWWVILTVAEKFRENSNFSSSRSSKVIDLGANRKRICNFLLVVNSNFGRISYRFRDIDA